MRNLKHPTLDAEDVLRKTIEAKDDPERRTRLNALLPLLLGRYSDWAHDPAGALDSFAPVGLTDEQEEDLLHCYTYRTTPINQLIRHIREVQARGIRSKCHYCGIDAPRRTDHYLPKESFAEFAIHPMNLLPACVVCNEKKGKILREGATGPRVVRHLYIDQVPTVGFLRARIHHVDGDPVAEFELDLAAVPQPARNGIESQFTRLGLLGRYAEAANDVIDDVRSWLCEYAEGQTVKQAAAKLRREAARRSRVYGPNLWEGVLLIALANDDTFMRSCQII